ncbi:hypothetical protein K458DRAFT_396613 [Lentithecium fluviatile CBS 122367]|uniref:DUF7580 domain-containing protein n=1 Tax=Lentithecium fluviatile CBS 122367 TaxID=1168545 RepID=A0A6G1IFA6_9PLEO|nr:hypothetical protein K458DRAFT_396613 [Lentithecium fluviatile CBS 122367]
MSGVEVAGLVLGCLPLLIQGIETYNEGLDPVKAFVRWERDLPQLIRKLRNQHVHYAQTMRVLLEPITTEFELAEMLSDPAGAHLWKDKYMAEKLRNKLEDSYDAYQDTIAEIERITKKIASKLDLDRAAELKKNDLEALLAANPKKSNDKFEFRKRVRFGMSKKSIKALLGELDDCNKELERFTDKSEKIESFRKTVKPSFANKLQRIQKYATSLHQTLSSCWACSCKNHSTSLELDQRGSLYASGMKTKSITSKTCFKVSFASGPNAQFWSCQAAEIFIEDEDEDDHCGALHLMAKPKMTKSVSFSDKPPPPYSPTDPAETSHSPLQEVKDLCASIQQFYKNVPCIGFSFDTKNRLRGAYPINTASEKRAASSGFVTLEELLNRPPVVNGRPAKLSKKERYSLALTLASSTLQLNATPWFPDQWAAKDILFPRMSNGPLLVDVDHPYVAPSQPTDQKTITNGGRKPRGFQNKNTVLLALAIALLELYFGVSAQKHQELEHESAEFAANPWTLCAMAYEWADEEQENLSAAFSTAVNHCLRCFSDPGASLQSADFLQAAVESIVLPLQDELYQFLGKPGP